MSTINDGGAAFPLGANEYAGHGPWRGMSLRDYLAAHAPAPQSWFIPDASVLIEVWQTPGGMPAINSTNPMNRDACGQQIPNVLINAAEVHDSQREYQRQLAIQWPWVWADAMVAERARRA